MMLAELTAALAAVPATATRAEYSAAIVDGNCLGKATASTRRLTDQRLGEIYGLDAAVPLFRVLRRLWDLDPAGRPLLALSTALARDPLFLSTASAVVPLAAGSEFLRDPARAAAKSAVGERLNDAVLDKVIRNAASSWTQSGHLVGRTFKRRRLVSPTASTVAFSLYLGYVAGFRGEDLLGSGWVAALDADRATARDLAMVAKRLGLIDLRTAGDVFEVGFERLDPSLART